MNYNFICKKCKHFSIDGNPVRIGEKYVWFCKDCYLEREFHKIDEVPCGGPRRK